MASFVRDILLKLHDAVHTTVFDSTMHTYIMWCSVHNSFGFHNANLHHVMQCAQQFLILQCSPTSCDAVCTIVLDSTMHSNIAWCSVHNSCGFHNSHRHHVMQCAQQFLIPQCSPTSCDAVRTTVFHSTTHTYIMWCSAHNSFSFHNTHVHHVMQCAQ